MLVVVVVVMVMKIMVEEVYDNIKKYKIASIEHTEIDKSCDYAMHT